MQKPDFTGEWTLNVDASALSPVVAPVVQSGKVDAAFARPNSCALLTESRTTCGCSTAQAKPTLALTSATGMLLPKYSVDAQCSTLS